MYCISFRNEYIHKKYSRRSRKDNKWKKARDVIGVNGDYSRNCWFLFVIYMRLNRQKDWC